MSGRSVNKLLQELEKSKHQQNHHDTEEDEHLGDSGGYFNRYAILMKQDEEELDIGDETHVHPSKKKKKKKSKESGAKLSNAEITSGGFTTDTNADGESSKTASSRPLLETRPAYLSLEKGLKRLYGLELATILLQSRQDDGPFKEPRRGSDGVYHPHNNILITPSRTWPRWDYSLSMEFIGHIDGKKTFTYIRSTSYEEAQKEFKTPQDSHSIRFVQDVLQRYPYNIDLLFCVMNSYRTSKNEREDALGRCLYALERAWHPLFTPFERNCRLDSNEESNKPFFRTLLLQIRCLAWAGLNKSAFELCKLLISLHDPADALLCVDYFALRVGEYSWLERFARDYRANDDPIWLLPNFSFSLAVARLRLEETEAEVTPEQPSSLELMKQALILYPTVLHKLAERTPLKDAIWDKILKHPYFKTQRLDNPSLDRLIDIYVERSYVIWRSKDANGLLKEAARKDIEMLQGNLVDERDWVCVRKLAFPSEINEYSHLCTDDFTDTLPYWHTQAVPVDEDDVPLVEDAGPLDEDAVPVVEDADAVPLDEDAVPVVEDAVPLDEDAVPVVEDAGPVEEDAVPLDEEAGPLAEGNGFEDVVDAVQYLEGEEDYTFAVEHAADMDLVYDLFQ